MNSTWGSSGSSWHESWPIIWTAQGFNHVTLKSPTIALEVQFSQCRHPFFLVQLQVLPGILMVLSCVTWLLLEIPTNLAVKRSYLTVSDSIIPNDNHIAPCQTTPHPKSQQIPTVPSQRPGHANSEAQHPSGHGRTVGWAAGEVPEPRRANAAVGTRSDEGRRRCDKSMNGRRLTFWSGCSWGARCFFSIII